MLGKKGANGKAGRSPKSPADTLLTRLCERGHGANPLVSIKSGGAILGAPTVALGSHFRWVPGLGGRRTRLWVSVPGWDSPRRATSASGSRSPDWGTRREHCEAEAPGGPHHPGPPQLQRLRKPQALGFEPPRPSGRDGVFNGHWLRRLRDVSAEGAGVGRRRGLEGACPRGYSPRSLSPRQADAGADMGRTTRRRAEPTQRRAQRSMPGARVPGDPAL